MMPDNWKHRSENMRCKTCMFFVPKIPFQPRPMEPEKGPGNIPPEPPELNLGPGKIYLRHPGYDLGRCRRHAPTLSGWPAVFVNDWCGDHKIDEEKLHGSG